MLRSALRPPSPPLVRHTYTRMTDGHRITMFAELHRGQLADM